MTNTLCPYLHPDVGREKSETTWYVEQPCVREQTQIPVQPVRQPPSRASLLRLPSSQRLTRSLGVADEYLTLWLRCVRWEVILCHIDRFYGRWGTCWVSSLMMFLFKSVGSLWHSQLRLVCTLSLQLKCSLQAAHLRSALGQAKISLSKVWKYVVFAVLIEKDLKKMPKLSADLWSSDSVTSPSQSSSLMF